MNALLVSAANTRGYSVRPFENLIFMCNMSLAVGLDVFQQAVWVLILCTECDPLMCSWSLNT